MRWTKRFESAGITEETKNSFAGFGPDENALLSAPWRGSSPVPRALYGGTFTADGGELERVGVVGAEAVGRPLALTPRGGSSRGRS